MNDKDQNPSEFRLHVHALNKITIFLINYFSFQFQCGSEGALIYGKLFWQNTKFNNSLSFRDCFFVGLIYSMLDDGFHFWAGHSLLDCLNLSSSFFEVINDFIHQIFFILKSQAQNNS